jgi:hypothetical protein
MAEAELSSKDIDRIVARATKFLGALSQNSRIRDLLVAGGYDAEEHERGWQLLLELLGYRPSERFASGPEMTPQAAAEAALDAWDGPAFERSRYPLERAFPAQAQYIFENLAPKTGREAVGAVATFLDRVAALRDGTDPARAATREQDRKAAALLEKRRVINAAEEQRLRTLIADAKRLADATAPPPPLVDPGRRQLVARELQAFLRDWRETARVLVTRRDYQIQLGLAERRSRRKGADADERRAAPDAAEDDEDD